MKKWRGLALLLSIAVAVQPMMVTAADYFEEAEEFEAAEGFEVDFESEDDSLQFFGEEQLSEEEIFSGEMDSAETEDVIAFSDGEAISEYSEGDLSVEAAAIALRAGMVNREASIQVTVDTGEVWEDWKLEETVLALALQETENSYEGDYLVWDIKPAGCLHTHNGTTYNMEYRFEYYTSYEQEVELSAEIQKVIQELGITEETSDYQKIKKIYDYIRWNVEYDWDNVLTDYAGQYSAYNALIKKIAVCQGYSKLLYRMLKEVGINSRCVLGNTGVEGIDHMWNVVMLDGRYYFCDVTSEAGGYDSVKYFMRGTKNFPGYECFDLYLEGFNISEEDYQLEEEEDLVSKEYTYILSPDGHAIIKKYIGEEENVIVPAEIDGYPVKEIASYAFWENEVMKSLTISEGIERVNQEWLYWGWQLKEIHYPSSLNFVYNKGGVETGLSNNPIVCPKIEKVTIAEGNETAVVYNDAIYSKDMSTLLYYPPNCSNRDCLEIPDGVKRIQNDACSDSIYLKEVIMPDSVEYIGYCAFDGATSLERINISENCRFIGQWALAKTAIKELYIPEALELLFPVVDNSRMMEKLERIIVAPDNKNYFSIEGVLYDRNGVLLWYPEGKMDSVFKVFEGTKVIGENAMENAKFSEIILCKSLEKIEKWAFKDCLNMGMITLPSNITKIAEKAIGYRYYEDSKIKLVIYGEEGSAAQSYAQENGFLFRYITDNSLFEGTCGEKIKWHLDREGILYIEGAGRMQDYALNGSPWEDFKAMIAEVRFSEGITNIGAFAFWGCSRLKNIEIVQSIESIGDRAFGNCAQLYKIKIPYNVKKIDGMIGDWDKLTIYGFAGSCSQVAAEQFGLKFVPIVCEGEHKMVCSGREPTCTEPGEKAYYCEICKETRTETLPALGHSFKPWKTAVKATIFAPETQNVPVPDAAVLKRAVTEIRFKV